MGNAINLVPQFTQDDQESRGTGQEVTVQPEEATTDEVVEEGKENPAEPPAAEKPAEAEQQEPVSQEAVNPAVAEHERQKQGLQEELIKLRKEISELRGQKRDLKQQEINKVQQQIDELKDLHPDDVAVIDRVLRAKGYVTREEQKKMYQEAVRDEELRKFLDKYPEYKPENDPHDLNWGALERELQWYRQPENPHAYAELLERAHRVVSAARTPSDRNIPEKRRQVQIASVGSGGVQRSSSPSKSLDPAKRQVLLDGGWSEEEIRKIESKL